RDGPDPLPRAQQPRFDTSLGVLLRRGKQVDMNGREDFEALVELLSVARNAVLRYPMSAVVDRTDHEGVTVSSKVHVEGVRRWSVEGDDHSITCDPVDGCVIKTGHSVE